MKGVIYKKIGKDIFDSDEQLQLVLGGYDHNFVLRDKRAAKEGTTNSELN